MPKYRTKPEFVEAIQFNYVDGVCDSPETVELAQSLNLSRNGSSKLWELHSVEGWRIVYSGDYIITDAQGYRRRWSQELFEKFYELAVE